MNIFTATKNPSFHQIPRETARCCWFPNLQSIRKIPLNINLPPTDRPVLQRSVDTTVSAKLLSISNRCRQMTSEGAAFPGFSSPRGCYIPVASCIPITRVGRLPATPHFIFLLPRATRGERKRDKEKAISEHMAGGEFGCMRHFVRVLWENWWLFSFRRVAQERSIFGNVCSREWWRKRSCEHL